MYINNIGIKAGVIWHLLFENGELNMRNIGELTGYKDSVIFLAIGWLAREDKLKLVYKRGMAYIRLSPNNI
ncbi:winged helix-turn-helix domain-containing protein [Dysgonomonas sp. Marseille-P4677]|uniref:winged helix-turn-helix domain-containing protein n=1 Tax=Dysgonomonas sp. Marseille-P4677 TaxID=2364790 RepID=UPI001911E983|nr:winged helix-turn-helix domain-containing protein [Dysgonomonas sp. Marseille-P4677]MBK5720934.1 winged helix-turn-helix domain-containing protein [Dysgonomonas sp. Marseille-P4677]